MSTEEAAAAPASVTEEKPASAIDQAPLAKKASAKPKKANAASKPRAPLAHPPYAEMITEAISALKERTGSSQHAITKFIEDKYSSKLSSIFKKIILLQLKKLTAGGKLTKIKASYKLSSSVTKTQRAAAKPKIKANAKPKAKTASKPKTKKSAAPTKNADATKPKVAALKTKKAVPKAKGNAPAAEVAKKSVKDAPLKKKMKLAPAKKAAAMKKTPVKKATPAKKVSKK